MGIINYGFGKEYLPNWGIKEALREVYQNYLDYGDYTVSTKVNKKDNTLINFVDLQTLHLLIFITMSVIITSNYNKRNIF